MKRRRNFFFVAAALATLVALLPTPAFSADKWTSVRSKNFLLVGDASENQIRRVARNLEQFRAAFALMFPSVEKRSSAGTTIVVFKNNDALKPYAPANADAFFQHGDDVNYIAISGDVSSSSLILHEYVHSLMKDSMGDIPVWLSEGLAEYYSTFQGQDREFSLGGIVVSHMRNLNQNPLIPLETFMAVDHASPYYTDKAKQDIFYAQAWVFVHYFMLNTDRARQQQFSNFLSMLRANKSVTESFNQAFQTNYATLERQLRDYVRNGRAPAGIKLVLRNTLEVDKEMSVSALTEGQAEYYLGDLLLHSQRVEEAETHLNKAIALDPELGVAYASLGMMRARQKKFPEALALLKRAVATDLQNYLVHYYYAYVVDELDRQNALPEADYDEKDLTIRNQLTKSIELEPTFLESYVQLAYLNLLTGEDLKETETLMAQAQGMAPGRQDLALLRAQALMRTNRVAEARDVLTALSQNATNPEIRKQAAQTLDNIDLYSDDKDAIRESLARREIIEEKKPEVSSATTRREAAPRARQEPVIEAENPLTARVQGEQITGLLINLDCTAGVTMRIKTDRETMDLHTDMPGSIEFLSYIPGVSNNITCGPKDPGSLVLVTYRKETREPLVVEFIEKN